MNLFNIDRGKRQFRAAYLATLSPTLLKSISEAVLEPTGKKTALGHLLRDKIKHEINEIKRRLTNNR
jgi:hypothetical protein